MNKYDFNNRTAVITGGGQGFGLDIAKRFLDSGAKVIIWDIDCLLYTSPSPRDGLLSRMPSSA